MMKSLLPLLLAVSTFAREIPVPNPAELDALSRNAQPGDVFMLASGTFADVGLRFRATGTAEQPITVRAAVSGQTILTGGSSLKIGGSHLRVEGLHFRQPGTKVSEVIQLRIDSKNLASHCTLSHMAITADPEAPQAKDCKWLSIYGSNNTIKSCTFTGKTSGGTTVVVWLPEDGSESGHHVIENCHFGPRPRLGKNGGESIRVGDSSTSHLDAHCLVTGCLFQQCNGETEIISNKSCSNRYLGNTFLECEGTLTLRHGHRCLVEGNIFIGNGKRLTGGIRVIGEDHTIRGNWLENLEGDGHRSALTFMNGIPDTPANGYQQVKRCLMENNVVLNAKVPLCIGRADNSKCTEAPLEVTFRANTILNAKRPAIDMQTPVSDWKWENNTIVAPTLGADIAALKLSDKAPQPSRPKPLTPTEVGAAWLR